MTNIKKIAVEYAKLVEKENSIKDEKKKLGLRVKAEMKKMGAKQFGVEQGLFTIHSIPTYTFSKKVEKKLAEVEAFKELEINKGVAKANYSEFIWYKTNK